MIIIIFIIIGFLIYYYFKDLIFAITIPIITYLIYLSLIIPQLEPMSIETMKSGKKNKKKKKSKSKKKFKLDVKKTFYENYKNLSSNQVKGLNKDTKSLIKTQKNLMKTLNDIGPVLSQGKSIINAFDNFFGSDNKLGADKNDLAFLSKMTKK